MLIESFNNSRTWAVIGANDNPQRFGSILYKHLKRKGYTVYAVNPKHDTVDGDPCYPNLTALPVKPEAIDMVVAPAAGEKIIREAASLGITRIWFQPGTWRDDFAQLTDELGLEIVRGCVLVEFP
ncbi:MAG: CoA-binding protein [Clostridia bacterium]|nr:CoA-binding protein [Clostridia bacterium]